MHIMIKGKIVHSGNKSLINVKFIVKDTVSGRSKCHQKIKNHWINGKKLTEKLDYEEITRIATKKYVYVGVVLHGKTLEITVSNNPAISTLNSSFYYWVRLLLQNSWLNIYDSKVDILNITIIHWVLKLIKWYVNG